AAVKRIDDIRIDYPSSRTSKRNLKKPLWYKDPNEESGDAASATASTSAAGGNPQSEMMSKMGGMMGGMLGGGRSGPSGATKNGLNLYRYFDVNEQVRRMPVGMVLIVNAEDIPLFLGAFANSKLRTQTLQCHWTHTRERVQPIIEE